MTALRLVARALLALWRVGLVRVSPFMAWRIYLAWRRCRGTMAFLAEVAALRFGSRQALVDDDGAVTFAALRASYEALARRLVRQLGAGPGRKVVILGRNHRSLVVGLLAAARSGADVLLLDPDSPPGALANALVGQNADIILHAPELDVAVFASDARRIALTADASDGFANEPLPRVGHAGRLLVLTSGSTGTPKSIGRKPSIPQLLPVLLGLFDALPIVLHRPTLLAVPLFHGHGLATLATALACAAPLHLGRRYEIAPLLSRASIEQAPIVVSVPTLLFRWLAAGPVTTGVAAVVSGSAPLDAQLCRRVLDGVGPVLYNLYGSTEAGVVSLATPAMLRAAPGTVGQPLPGNEVRLLDGNGQLAPPGQIGRIHARGPLVVRGDAEGWLDTGDLGRWDEAGCLHVCGRADGMFVSGGENVYPQEVEGCLRDHPAVAEAAIAVVPDAEFGQRMRAFVVVRKGDVLPPEDLRAWLRERLDRCKLPRSIELVPALPRNALGKIDRPALQRILERAQT